MWRVRRREKQDFVDSARRSKEELVRDVNVQSRSKALGAELLLLRHGAAKPRDAPYTPLSLASPPRRLLLLRGTSDGRGTTGWLRATTTCLLSLTQKPFGTMTT